MSSVETPPDPGEPEPTAEEVRIAVRNWLFLVGQLAAIAMLLMMVSG